MTANHRIHSLAARVGAVAVLACTAACPSTPAGTTEGEETTSSSTTDEPGTDTSTGETTGDTPVPTTSDGPGTSSSTGESETETTGMEAQAGPARVFYTVQGEKVGHARALRFVDVVDGVASAPQTVIEAVGEVSLRHAFFESSKRRWFAIPALLAPEMWLVDPLAGTATAVTVPAGVTSLAFPQFSPDERMLAVSGVSDSGSAIYVCEIEAGGGCALAATSPALPAGFSLPLAPFSSDGERLVYFARDEDTNALEILLGGTAQPGEAAVLASLPAWAGPLWTSWSADEGVFYYFADAEADGEYALFGVDVSAAPPAPPKLLYTPSLPTPEVQPLWAPDRGELVVWFGDEYGDLERVRLDGLAAPKPVLVNNLSSILGHVARDSAAWSPDSQRLAFTAYHLEEDRDEAYVVDFAVAPPAATKVGAPMPATSKAIAPSFSPDSQRLLYLAYEGFDSPTSLMWASVAPVGEAGSLAGDADVRHSDAWSADGSRHLYIARPPGSEVFSAFLAEFGAGAPVSWQLSGEAPVQTGDGAGTWYPTRLSADGRRAFFRVETGDEANALWTVEVGADGPSEPLVLSAPDDFVRLTAVFTLP